MVPLSHAQGFMRTATVHTPYSTVRLRGDARQVELPRMSSRGQEKALS